MKPVTITDTQAGVLNALKAKGYRAGAVLNWREILGDRCSPSVNALITKGLLRRQGQGGLVVIRPEAYATLDIHNSK